jgi:hypothetical protein
MYVILSKVWNEQIWTVSFLLFVGTVCDADHSPPFSVKVKSELELYVLSPLSPAW